MLNIAATKYQNFNKEILLKTEIHKQIVIAPWWCQVGQYLTIQDYIGLHSTLLDYTVYSIVQGYSGLYSAMQASIGLNRTNRTLEDYTELHRTIHDRTIPEFE